MDCLFCKIIENEISADLVHEDNEIIAFSDINPQAPVHKLIIPQKHIATINDLADSESQLIGDMVLVAKKIATDCGLADDGYRLVFNCNANAGQEVFHIHLHLLGGRSMQWPPG